jgi:hypothetical protein
VRAVFNFDFGVCKRIVLVAMLPLSFSPTFLFFLCRFSFAEQRAAAAIFN